MSKTISEETKQKIIQLYEQSNMSDGMIAQAVGVSERTVRRYGKSVGLGQALPDTTRRASPAVDRPSPLPDSTAGQYCRTVPDNKKRWLCKTPGCSFITDKKNVLCPRCQRGPFFSCFVEIGSPEYEQFIEENQKQEESEGPEKEDPRDPSKYKDPEPQDNKDSESQDNEESEDEKETNTTAVEEQQQEYEYECPSCHNQFNDVLDNCPHCGLPLEDAMECSKCRHRWYAPPNDHCPKCGYKPGFF
jgi:hypothetical protein